MLILSEIKNFFHQWLEKPKDMGALFPSCWRATRSAAREAIRLCSGSEKIIEVGPGTGRFMMALKELGFPEERIIGVEYDLEFFQNLRQSFPKAHMIHGDAIHLTSLLHPEDLKNIGVLFSSIPLAFFSPKKRFLVLEAYRAVLQQKPWIGLTLMPQSVVNDPIYRVKKEHIGTFLNIPPATLWRYQSSLSSRS